MTTASPEDRAMIRESARSFLADNATSADVRRWMATDLGYDPALWQRVSGELGWPGLPMDEAYGGLGLGLGETALLMEEMGASLFCSPFLSTVCLAGSAIRLGGNDSQKEEFLPAIALGELTAALAVTEPGGISGASGIAAEYRRDGDSYIIDGEKRFVVDGHSADLIFVAARKPGSEGEGGISLFAVPCGAECLSRDALPTLDQTRRQAELCLNKVRVPTSALMGEEGGGWPVLDKALDLGATALAAEQAGGARRCLELTVAYIQERVQFGRAIGSFQAIKHRAADMMVKVESAHAAAAEAADAADADDPDFPMFASMAKAYCSEAYFACAGEAIQLHGGVGFTWEYDPHLFFKRARASSDLLGTPAWHRERIAQRLGL
jgi:alkylation response protein AidB-like acyl-CoA dehydrogenase